MIFTWILININLSQWNEIFSQLWMQIKIVLVILLSAYNDYLGRCLNNLKNYKHKICKFFRVINEIPTVILIIVVFLNFANLG